MRGSGGACRLTKTSGRRTSEEVLMKGASQPICLGVREGNLPSCATMFHVRPMPFEHTTNPAVLPFACTVRGHVYKPKHATQPLQLEEAATLFEGAQPRSGDEVRLQLS